MVRPPPILSHSQLYEINLIIALPAVPTQPILHTTNLQNNTYVLLMIDPDAKFNGTTIEILHWLQQDLTLSRGNTTSNSTSSYTLTADFKSGLAPYVPPAPPAELPPRAHRYIQLLFQQPSNFSIPTAFEEVLQTRVGFDLGGFVEATGLGNVLAANYFLVANTSLVLESSGGGMGSGAGLELGFGSVASLVGLATFGIAVLAM